MVSCIKVETASLVFAILSLLCTSVGCLASLAIMVYLNIITYIYTEQMLESQKNVEMYIKSLTGHILLAVTLAIMAVSLAFSIILAKGLISKKPHLVKAYFIYGVTKTTLWALGAIMTAVIANNGLGMINLLGCLLYSIILLIIRKTYLKMSSIDYNELIYKKQEEKTHV